MRYINSKLVALVLGALLLFSLGACSEGGSNSPSDSPPTSIPPSSSTAPSTSAAAQGQDVMVDESFNGKEVKTAPGDSIQVTLKSNRTTGFSWQLVSISDPAVLEKVSDRYETPQAASPAGAPPMVGAGGQEVWTFKSLQKGRSQISMEYSRPWEGGEKGAQKFDLTVVVE